MELRTRIEILKDIIRQLDNTVEAQTFNVRICDKCADEKGKEAAKKVAAEVQGKLDAANQILKELETEEVKK